jgi:hypothetical protein
LELKLSDCGVAALEVARERMVEEVVEVVEALC